jgi:hypothetical protein
MAFPISFYTAAGGESPSRSESRVAAGVCSTILAMTFITTAHSGFLTFLIHQLV